jgi:mono/diheme cytochrome c family protein
MFKKISLFIVSVLVFSCSQDPNEKGIEVFPDMVYPVAYQAFSENSLTPNGETMLKAPKGSISRGYVPFHYGEGEAEAERAGVELKNPIASDAKSIERGKFLYTNTCQVCHGDTGKGDGPIIPKFPNPPSFTSRALADYPDGRMYHIITMGFGDMPSHSAQLNDTDRWHVVNYIRELQKIK